MLFRSRNCASLVEDGSCLQLGIGSIPDAVLANLKDKKDLGLHTEMFSDGAIELIESGVINCKASKLSKKFANKLLLINLLLKLGSSLTANCKTIVMPINCLGKTLTNSKS